MTGHVSELFDDLRLRLAEISGQPPETVAADDNLINLGLDSIQLMMLATELRALGVQVEFADLAAEPTLARWTVLAAERSGEALPEAVPGPVAADRFELTPMQYAHWIGRLDGQPFGGVGGHFYHEFAGPALDPQRLERAVTALLERHPMLRMRVDEDGFGLLPTEPAVFRLVVHDLRENETVAEPLRELRAELAHRTLDLAAGEVFDLRLSLLPDGTSRTHLNLDMIVADAMSLRVLLTDLAQLYATPDRPLPPVGIDFPGCLAAHARRRAVAHERDRDWWSRRIPDLPGAPALPLVDGAEAVARSSTVRRHFWLDAAQRARFARAARARGVTPAMAAAAVFAEVIGNWSAEPRFLLNLPLFDRERLHPDVDRVVGDFTNSVLLDVDVSASMTFADRAMSVQTRLHEVGRHTAYSGVEVLRDLSRAAGGRRVLAPVVYTSALNVGELFGTEFQRCFGRPEWIVSQAPQVWLDAQLAEVDGGLLVNWDCLDEVFPPGLIEDMFAAYRTLFTSLTAECDTAWDTPVPAFGDPGRSNGAVVSVFAEADLVESVLARVLALNPALGDLPRSGAELAAAFGVVDKHAGTHRTWLDWLAGREVLATDPRGYRLGDRFDQVATPSHWARLARTADRPATRRLAALAVDLPAVLRGQRPPMPGFADLVPARALGERLPPNGITVGTRTEDTWAAPHGEIEQAIAALWRDLLGVARVGRTDSFFVLGGDSLLATRFLSRLRAAGYPDVSITELFATPVLADFAAALLAVRSTEDAPTVPADLAHRHEPFPLTAVQRAYWFGRSESMALGGVGCHFYQEFDVDDLDVARLTDALNALVARHEMLRAVVDARGEQRILADVSPLTIPVVDADSSSAVAELRDAMSHRCFDPAVWPLFDVRVVRDGRRSRIGIGLDNLVLDALSVLAFYRELGQLYRDPALILPPIDVSFRDYALNVHPQPTAVETARQYWADLLDAMPPAPQLPLRVDPSQVGTPRFTRRETVIDADTWARLERSAREHGLTPSAVLLSAFAEVLGIWCGRPDLTLTVTLFDRQEVHPHIDRVFGDFTSLMLVSYQPDGVADWLSRVRRLQQRLVSDLAHRDYSAIDVLRDLGRRQGEQISAMPVVFTSALGGLTELAGPPAPPFDEPVWGISQTPQVWLDHQARQVRDAQGRPAVSVNWDSVDALFPDGLLDDMVTAYRTLIDWLGQGDWQAPVPDLLSPAQAAVRGQVNATAAPAGATLLHDAFFLLAADQPDAPAVLGEDGMLSYRDLADRALRVAKLLRDNDIRTGDLVGVTVAKGAAQLVAVLGVLAAGAGYVPIGVDQPTARRDRIIASAGLAALLVDEDSPQPAAVPVLLLADAAGGPAADAPVPVSADTIAYVIFTSGSTGTPKGVEITHRAAANTVEDINMRFGVTAADRVLAVSALDFDLSVYDIFGPLTVGGAVVTITESRRRDARQWAELVSRHGVTIWNTVPVLLDMLLVVLEGQFGAGRCPLRIALVSGDWVGLDLPDRLRAAVPGAQLVALGGATEASIWSNAFEVDTVDPEWRSIPYGFPLRNQHYRVVDPAGRDCPDWVPGELWIGGAGVARGYRGDPELTRQRFVTAAGERWYRTGDLGRYRPGGILEFLGRLDNQVKLRGHRIELGEIEAVLAEHDDVAQAVAVVSGGRRLVAGVLPVDLGSFDPAAVLAWAATRLPAHMVPDRLTPLDTVPLTANGKVDRAAVDRLSDNAIVENEPPRGQHELAVVRLWRRVLELDGEQRIGRDDNFFLLGGDSVLAIRFVELVAGELRADVALPGFFAGPTVCQVAELVAAAEMEEGAL